MHLSTFGRGSSEAISGSDVGGGWATGAGLERLPDCSEDLEWVANGWRCEESAAMCDGFVASAGVDVRVASSAGSTREIAGHQNSEQVEDPR